MSEFCYKVHMTRVQILANTARISNVDTVMFVDRNKRDGKFLRMVTITMKVHDNENDDDEDNYIY